MMLSLVVPGHLLGECMVLALFECIRMDTSVFEARKILLPLLSIDSVAEAT